MLIITVQACMFEIINYLNNHMVPYSHRQQGYTGRGSSKTGGGVSGLPPLTEEEERVLALL